MFYNESPKASHEIKRLVEMLMIDLTEARIRDSPCMPAKRLNRATEGSNLWCAGSS